jgi:hypothetical protein
VLGSSIAGGTDFQRDQQAQTAGAKLGTQAAGVRSRTACDLE